MAVDKSVGDPGLEVRLWSTLYGIGPLDITPHITYVRTQKTHGGLGKWVIRMTSEPLNLAKTPVKMTAYDFVNPNDYVEIAFSRGTQLKHSVYQEGSLVNRGKDVSPIVKMRGFVDEIRQTVAYASGKPTREIVIRGSDYTKLFQYTIHHYFQPEEPLAQLLKQQGYNSFIQNQLNGSDYRFKLEDLFSEVLLGSVNNGPLKFLRGGKDGSGGPQYGSGDKGTSQNAITNELAGINGDRDAVKLMRRMFFNYSDLTNFLLNVDTLAYQGSLWKFLQQWCGYPWHEMTVQDFPHPVGPLLVLRPAPYLTFGGNSITPTEDNFRVAPKLEGDIRLDYSDIKDQDFYSKPLTIEATDVQEIEMSRNDAEAYNYIATIPRLGFLDMEGDNLRTLVHSEAAQIVSHSFPIHGYRPLNMNTYHVWDFKRGHTPSDKGVIRDAILERVHILNKLLAGWNCANSFLEQGTVAIRGHEELIPGMFVNIPGVYGDSRLSKLHQNPEFGGKDMFVTSVTDTYIPFESYTTQFSYSRGHAFLRGLVRKVTGLGGKFFASSLLREHTKQSPIVGAILSAAGVDLSPNNTIDALRTDLQIFEALFQVAKADIQNLVEFSDVPASQAPPSP
jgi:hypothetical protein